MYETIDENAVSQARQRGQCASTVTWRLGVLYSPYVSYGVKDTDLVSLTLLPGSGKTEYDCFVQQYPAHYEYSTSVPGAQGGYASAAGQTTYEEGKQADANPYALFKHGPVVPPGMPLHTRPSADSMGYGRAADRTASHAQLDSHRALYVLYGAKYIYV